MPASEPALSAAKPCLPGPGTPGGKPALVDYAKSLDCIHCGLCLQTCPTFRLTGAEASSPRGRIHLMRAVAEERLGADAAFADEMEFCLLCRHCESVCPAGVQFGAMMEFTRGALELERPGGIRRRTLRWLGFRVVLPHRLVLRLLGSLLRAAQLLHLDRLADRLSGERGLRDLPRVPPLSFRRLLPARTAAAGATPRGEVALLEGCVMPEFYAHVNRATARSLARLGFDARVPRGVTCCGSLHAHNGDLEGARRLARIFIAAHERELDAQGRALPIVLNSAGCGAHLKVLQHLFAAEDPWHARAAAVSARVRDYSEFVAPLVAEAGVVLAVPEVLAPVTWDDPCHLCHGQGVRTEPRAILARLGVARVELEGSEGCCGSAGIYSLLRPAASRAVLARKLADLERSGARTLVTANPGCHMQWQGGIARAGSAVRVLHLAELVDAALRPPDDAPSQTGGTRA